MPSLLKVTLLSATVPSGHQWSVSNPLPVWVCKSASLASLQKFLRGATGRPSRDLAWPYFVFFWLLVGPPKKRSRWPPRPTHGEAKRHFREILTPKWPPKWRQKVIEFRLRWNCDFCYNSHAKSLFHCPGPLQKWCKISLRLKQKKKLCNHNPQQIFNFQLQGASGWQHEPKRLPKGFLLRGAGSTKNNSKRDPKCGREPTPQNGPSFSPNGCQDVLPKQYNLA